MNRVVSLQSNSATDLVTATLDALPQAIAVFDREGRVQACNQAWADLAEQVCGALPTTPVEWPDLPTGQDIPVVCADAHLSLDSAITRGLAGETLRGELRAPSVNDSLIIRPVRFQPLGANGSVTGCVAIVDDGAPEAAMRKVLEHRIDELRRETHLLHELSDSFREVMELINASHPLQDILDSIVERACALLHADGALILRLDPDGQMRVQAGTGIGSEEFANVGVPVGLVKISEAVQRREPVVVSDVPKVLAENLAKLPDPYLQGLAAAIAGEYQAALFVPLIAEGAVYGEIALSYRQPHTFTSEEMEIATSFCGPATLAIENARLLAEVQGKAILEERQRLARELHDSVTQSLYSLTLLTEAGRRLTRVGEHERVGHCLDQLAELSQQCLKEMRLLVYELRPMVLERVGLVGALQQRLDAVEKRAGLEASLDVEGEAELPEALVEDLFRIAQEALNNALKHATATRVAVRVSVSDDHVELEVIDNGKGFEQEALQDAGGMGLDTMHQRAERIGGTLTIQSTLGHGTRVHASIPLAAPPPPID